MANSVEIFDSASGETGSDVNTSNPELNLDKEGFVQVEIGSGDTVVIEGKIDSSLSYVVIDTFTADTLKAIKIPPIIRGRRTVDGGGGDTQIFLQKLDPTRGQ